MQWLQSHFTAMKNHKTLPILLNSSKKTVQRDANPIQTISQWSSSQNDSKLWKIDYIQWLTITCRHNIWFSQIRLIFQRRIISIILILVKRDCSYFSSFYWHGSLYYLLVFWHIFSGLLWWLPSYNIRYNVTNVKKCILSLLRYLSTMCPSHLITSLTLSMIWYADLFYQISSTVELLQCSEVPKAWESYLYQLFNTTCLSQRKDSIL